MIFQAAWSYVRSSPLLARNWKEINSVFFNIQKDYSFLVKNSPVLNCNISSAILPICKKSEPSIIPNFQCQSNRTLTKYSLRTGKRKTVHNVLQRFYRLNWGMWIRGKCGRNKKMYKKSSNQKRRLRQHVMTNGTQSWLLDKMVTNYWRKPKYYVDDPYEPYHWREEFPLTRRKPWTPPVE